MGNVLEGMQSSGDIRQEDLKWLATTNDSLFNDGFLAEVFESLDKPVDNTNKNNNNAGNNTLKSNNDDENGTIYETSLKAQHLRDIFSNISYAELDKTSVECMPSLCGQESLETNYNSITLERRARVLERVHLVSISILYLLFCI